MSARTAKQTHPTGNFFFAGKPGLFISLLIDEPTREDLIMYMLMDLTDVALVPIAKHTALFVYALGVNEAKIWKDAPFSIGVNPTKWRRLPKRKSDEGFPLLFSVCNEYREILYTRECETTPAWSAALEEIVENQLANLNTWSLEARDAEVEDIKLRVRSGRQALKLASIVEPCH